MRIRMAALLAALTLLLGGCTALPAEERAFAVALGVDRAEDMWQACARIPTYQAGGEYATVWAEESSLEGALAALNASAPMQLHYGQLRLVAVGQSAAEQGALGPVIRLLHRRGDVRGEAALCVTDAPLAQVMEAMSPATGTRLSKSVELLLEARQGMGTIPRPTLDGWLLNDGARQTTPIRLTVLPGDKPRVELGGCWLTDASGRTAGSLTPAETQLLGLLCGTWRQGAWMLPGGAVTLTDASRELDLAQGGGVIRLRLRVRAGAAQAEDVRSMAQEELARLAERLAEAGCDPPGLPARPWRVEVEVACGA